MNADFIVVDASVLLKWYLNEDEPHRTQALLLFERFRSGKVRILLPEIAMHELGNRLIRLPGAGVQVFADAVELLTDVVPFGPEDLKRTAACAARVLGLGLKGIAMYDCAYIHLARVTDSPLLTADRLQAAAARSLDAKAILIEEYK